MKLAGKIAVISICLVVLIVLLVNARKDSSPYIGTTKPSSQTRLVYNIMTEPTTIDPQIPNDNVSNAIADSMFDGLTEYHPQTLEPIAALATHYEVNADSTQFTFYLRGHKSPKGIRLPNRDDLHQQFLEGKLKEDFSHGHAAPPDDQPAYWSDGTIITARDFVYSWQRAVSPATAAANAGQLAYIKNGANITAGLNRFRDKKTGQFLHGKLDQDGHVLEDPGGPLIKATTKAIKRSPQQYAEILKMADLAPYTPDELGVRAVDDFTFQVDLIQPTSFFLKLMPMSIFRAVPKQAIEAAANRAKKSEGNATDWLKPENIVVSGAFKLAERMPYDHVLLTKNPRYWDAASVDLQQVNFLPIEDRVTGMSLYKSGNVDVSTGGSVPTSFVGALRNNKRDLIIGPATTVVFYVFNTTAKPFDDVRIRRALDLSVDKQAIVDVKGNGQVPQWRLTPTFPDYAPQHTGRYDPAEGKRLLAAAGYPNGIGPNGAKLHLSITYATNEGLKQTGELLKSFWENNLGIEVELQNMEAKVYQQALI